jgi:carbamate kinase
VELPLFSFSFALALGWILQQCQNQRYNSLMKHSFEETLIAVWRQALVDEADVIKLGSGRYLVTRSKAKMLRQVVFAVDGNSIIGIEQNPKTKSRWAALARSGKKVMQFIQDGRYAAVVADGKVTFYGNSIA